MSTCILCDNELPTHDEDRRGICKKCIPFTESITSVKTFQDKNTGQTKQVVKVKKFLKYDYQPPLFDNEKGQGTALFQVKTYISN